MEIRLTLLPKDPEKQFVRDGMFRHEESARAFALRCIREKMERQKKRASKNKLGKL